jgi:cytochrome c peroxidase
LVSTLKTSTWILVIIAAAVAALVLLPGSRSAEPWTNAELVTIQSLSLAGLPPIPADLSNAVADEPAAVVLGHRLFFDPRFSANGKVACATCHQPDLYFTDGLAVSIGIGPVQRNAMTLVGAAYSPWLFWDGRKDSLWAQAAGPLEHPLEHGSNRLQIARVLGSDQAYRQSYEALFGPLPLWLPEEDELEKILANVGKALAAYQRTLRPGPSRFDRYAASLASTNRSNPAEALKTQNVLDQQERLGLRLFIGKGQCTNCHNGPLLTNNAFHNTGSLSAAGQLPSRGRIEGVLGLVADPFNCLGAFNDDPQRACAELRFMKTGDELLGAHRTPSLRNVSRTSPYMHAGQLDSLEAVIAQYDVARDAMIGHNEAKPLDLTGTEKAALVGFLRTLDGAVDVAPRWLAPPE